jgi:hypothetical protein
VAGDAPYQPYRGAYVYPRNRPVHHKYVVYYYVGGQRREAYRNYYAPVYPYYSDTAIRPGLYPDRSYPSYMQSGGYYYMTGSPGTAYSPY